MTRKTTMTLRQRQSIFVKLTADLIQYAYEELGYELTFGEAWRTPEQAALNAKKGKGISNSLHCDRLAIDLNLFIDGKYCTDTESHRPLGAYWEALHPCCVWGGSWGNDGNHYAFTDGRRK